MINKIKLRGANENSLKSSLNYIMKYKNDAENGGAFASSIPKKSSSTEAEYSSVVVRKFEKTRQKGQKNLYAFTSLSFSHADSKKMTDEEALEIAKDFYLNEAYPGPRHFVFTVENDKEHKHVHAIIGLTDLKTKKVFNKFVDFKPIADKLEIKYNLERVQRNAPAPSPFTPAPNSRKIEERTGVKTIKNGIKNGISNAFIASIDFNDFLDNLKTQGVLFVPNVNAGGLCGASFIKDGEMFKGSQLGYTAKTIKDKFEKTKGYRQFIDFHISNKSASQVENYIFNETGQLKINRNFKHNKNYVADGSKVLHKESNKLAYDRVEKNKFLMNDTNLKTIAQAIKELNATNEDGAINTSSKNKQYQRNIWIVCKQNNIEVADFYTPSHSDYLFAIKNCFDENQKEALTKEMKERFKERKKNKNGLYLDE